ncbi:MAG: hypothetical protein OXU27_18000 [Candidatus Poribacteria bacterium]|nr:hypothetical protein [Candidatus Poribacteria bacterium]
MKTILVLTILFSAIALPALGELTVQDIEKIDTKIQASEDRIKEYINIKNESIDKRLSLVTTLIVGLIALIVLAVVIPQAILTLRESGNRERDRKIEELTKEIETLKQQIVSP